MKSFILIIGFFLSSKGFAVVDATTVELRMKSTQTVSAGHASIEFQLIDTKQNRELKPQDLVESHERILHLLVYDPSLTQFQHVHPEFTDGYWKVDLNFYVNGNYYVWAQGVTTVEFVNFSSLTRLQVINGQMELPAPPVLTDVRQAVDSGTIATLSNVKLKAGSKVGPTLKFSREDGSAPSITPYLGAFAHVIAVPADGNSLVHVHPQSGQTPDEGVVHFRFEKSGGYRVWIQCVDDGILKTVAMSVIVE